MNILKKTLEIKQTLRNVGRLKEILTVFARNGFQELLVKARLHELVPGFVFGSERKNEWRREYGQSQEDMWKSLGKRFKNSCEELGPAFVKLGQLMATREDLFPESFVQELRKLQDEVKPEEFKDVQKTVEKLLNRPITEVFRSIDPKPIASASMATVFKAVLLSGEIVVVKLKRSQIDQIVERDFDLILMFLEKIEKNSEFFQGLSLTRSLEDFYRALQWELNFAIERHNLERLRKNKEQVPGHELLVFPKTYPQYSFPEMLVMEYLEGIPFNRMKPLEVTQETKEKLLMSVKFFMHSLLKDGFFHADLHGGNFLLLSDGRLGVLDFGLVGTLSGKNLATFLSLLYHLKKGDFDQLTYDLLQVCDYELVPQVDSMRRDLEFALTPLMALEAKELDAAKMMKMMILILGKHRLYLPREWSLVFRALIVLDGVGRGLGIEFSTAQILDLSGDLLNKKLFNQQQWWEEGALFAKDISAVMRQIPRHVQWLLQDLSKHNYALEFRHRDLKESAMLVQQGMKFLGLSVLLGSFIVSMSAFLPKEAIFSFSQMTWPLYLLGSLSAVLIYSLLKFK